MSARRLAAIGALVFGAIGAVLAVATAMQELPRGPLTVAVLGLAIVAGWYGFVRRGVARLLAVVVASIAIASVVLLAVGDGRFQWILIAALVGASSACARVAFGARARLPAQPAPRRPVLFVNPRSGGGRARRVGLAAEAEARDIEVVELQPGDELGELVRAAVAAGADGLAMAGGDGSQAVVAAIAAEADLPFACIPAGTRNHFALDLGVDRDDVVGALDAFVVGGERRVDLAEVNGRTFVNNVSLGIYAEAVQREGYRETKMRTLLATLADWRRTDGGGAELRWTGPGGHRHRRGAAILVSNNSYRLGHVIGSGTRPRIDDARLGIAVAGAPTGRGGRARLPQRPWRDWTAPSFEVGSDGLVPAGVDGEAAMLEPPLRFRIRPGALRVRVARKHPGASPSALIPEHPGQAIRALARIALRRQA